jgi:hypothetical protein
LEGKRDGGENAKGEENPPQGPHRFGSLRERGEKINLDFFFFNFTN